MVLRGDIQVADSLGQVGYDPGVGWTCLNGSTYNTTLRRQDGICTGDDNFLDLFDPCDEYDFFPSDTFDGLGYHTEDCLSVSNGNTSWDSLKAAFK